MAYPVPPPWAPTSPFPPLDLSGAAPTPTSARPPLTLNGPQTHNPPLQLAPVGSGSLPTLQVLPAEAVRIDPPVPLGATLAHTAHASSQPGGGVDLELEKSLVQAASTSLVEEYLSTAGVSLSETVLDSEAARFVSMGFEQPAASLASAYAKQHRLAPEKAVDFARNYMELTSEMGFAPSLAAGALLRHGNKLEDAADSCLAAV